jgi:hypothetical protein
MPCSTTSGPFCMAWLVFISIVLHSIWSAPSPEFAFVD